MSDLKCTVQSCAHNSSGLCTLSSIQVGGQNAHTSNQTACESFRERGNSTSNDAGKQASPQTSIRCEACHCTYNDDCRCTADNVCVDTCSCGTECRTFRE